MMNEAFQARLDIKLAVFRDWMAARQRLSCRLVQYCGVDLVGSRDVPASDVEAQIEGLFCEGLRVDWSEHEGRLYLRVWEFGGPEPEWNKVVAEQPLADIDEILRKANDS